MMREDLEQQLEALLDKQAISELVHAYCNAADRHDFDKMRALYHDDAIDEHGKFAKGPASEFLNKLPEIQAPMAVLHQNVTTINLKLDGAERKSVGEGKSGEVRVGCGGRGCMTIKKNK